MTNDKDVSMHEYQNFPPEYQQVLNNIDEKLKRIETKVDNINGTVKEHSLKFVALDERQKWMDRAEDNRKWLIRAIATVAITALGMALWKALLAAG